MEREKFEDLVDQAVKSLPAEFLDHLDNVEVMVADQPTANQLRKSGLKPIRYYWVSMKEYRRPGAAVAMEWYCRIR